MTPPPLPEALLAALGAPQAQLSAIGAARQREMAAYDRLTPRLRCLLQGLAWPVDPIRVERILEVRGEDAAARWAVQRSARMMRVRG